jgi:hypothetical protein
MKRFDALNNAFANMRVNARCFAHQCGVEVNVLESHGEIKVFIWCLAGEEAMYYHAQKGMKARDVMDWCDWEWRKKFGEEGEQRRLEEIKEEANMLAILAGQDPDMDGGGLG